MIRLVTVEREFGSGAVDTIAGVAVCLALLLGSPRSSAAQSIGQPQSKFLGSVPTGEATGTTLLLSLKDTFDRALKYNLGLLESDQDVRAARAARLRGLNALLPDISAHVSGSREQLNLAASGFNITHSRRQRSHGRRAVRRRRRAGLRLAADLQLVRHQALEVDGGVRTGVAVREQERSRDGHPGRGQRLSHGDLRSRHRRVDSRTAHHGADAPRSGRRSEQGGRDRGNRRPARPRRAADAAATAHRRREPARHRQAGAGAGHRSAERPGVPDHGLRAVCAAGRHHAGPGARTRGHDAG